MTRAYINASDPETDEESASFSLWTVSNVAVRTQRKWLKLVALVGVLSTVVPLVADQRAALSRRLPSQRLFVVRDPAGYGFIDRSGTLVIPLRYRFADDFSGGLAAVWVEPRLCGYIDESGRRVIAPRFAYCRQFHDGVAAVEVAGGWTYIRQSGTPITSEVFADVGRFEDDRGPVKINGLWGFIDSDGRWAIPPRFRIAWGFSQGRAVVYEEARCAVIDALGTVLRRLEGGDCAGDPDGIMSVRGPNSKYAYVRRDGTLITPFKFEWAGPFVDGLAAIRLEGRTGFIDTEGREAIPPNFDGDSSAVCSRELSEGLIPVMVGGKCGYIDRTGATVIEPRFDIARGFHDGLAFVCVDQWCGYIDHVGAVVWMSKPFR